ncbi:cell wall hydrolase [Bacillus sp. Marseille-P3661]|uniref:cell wall hydrolase n=1 Tax=Bacillus sp. Marseille-P3661 TaxID=1936234 RepID=UPI000C821D27|nr:cell wall hydrolase [Bacillus sp. Marseille-P3661]
MVKHKFFNILSLVFILILLPITNQNNASAAQKVLQQGMTNGYVYDLQHRLQQNGVYDKNITGHFDVYTKQAVLNFQRNYGLTTDGIVGPNTWKKIYKYTLTENEIEILAKLVHGEARGESFEGKVAVAAVVLNRIDSNDFPSTVKDVVFEPQAFTAIADGQYYNRPNKDAYRAVYAALSGWDPSEGALFYFNPNTATSPWIWSRPQIKRIDKHIFAM